MDKKEEILLAAEAAFLKYGIRKITLDDIAQSCGMKKTALYYYYKNKEAILAAMLEKKFLEVFEEVKREVGKADNVKDKLRSFMHGRINAMRNNLPLFNLISSEENRSFRAHEFMEQNRKQIMERDFCLVNDILKMGVKNNKISYRLNDSLILMILGATYGTFVGRFMDNADWDIDSMIDTTVDVIMKGIK